MQVNGNIEFNITQKTAKTVVAHMPVQAGILNPFGIVNAGAILWFADVSASILVLEGTTMSEGMAGFPLAINLNANLVGNSKTGTFIANAEFVKKGRTVSVVRTLVTDLDGKLIAEVTTNHVLSK